MSDVVGLELQYQKNGSRQGVVMIKHSLEYSKQLSGWWCVIHQHKMITTSLQLPYSAKTHDPHLNHKENQLFVQD